jgi:glutathione S-transferase
MLKIHGVPFSAHTRKVIVTAIQKGLPYEIVPVVPLAPPQGWAELSPLGLIPVLQDEDYTLADSSVICAYLERRYPENPIYPAEPRAYGRALWFEEFIDSGLSPHVLRGLLMQRVFAPKFLKQAPDEALIEKSLTEFIPKRLSYLEASLTREYLAGDSFSIADITVVSMLVNFHYAGEAVDERTYPKLSRYLQSVARRPCFATALSKELGAAEKVGGLDLSFIRGLASSAD